jgi:hypothetical protein
MRRVGDQSRIELGLSALLAACGFGLVGLLFAPLESKAWAARPEVFDLRFTYDSREPMWPADLIPELVDRCLPTKKADQSEPAQLVRQALAHEGVPVADAIVFADPSYPLASSGTHWSLFVAPRCPESVSFGGVYYFVDRRSKRVTSSGSLGFIVIGPDWERVDRSGKEPTMTSHGTDPDQGDLP